MSTYTKKMQRIVLEYQESGGEWPAASSVIANWAIRKGLWAPQPALIVARCAEDISKAMREEYMTDSRGRRVRTKHPARVTRRGEQMVLWDDIRTAPREHMQISFQQRRKQIVGDCRQLKTDIDSYNDAHADEKPLQLIFDFTMDLLELEAAA